MWYIQLLRVSSSKRKVTTKRWPANLAHHQTHMAEDVTDSCTPLRTCLIGWLWWMTGSHKFNPPLLQVIWSWDRFVSSCFKKYAKSGLTVSTHTNRTQVHRLLSTQMPPKISATLEGVQMAQDSHASRPVGLKSKRHPPVNFLDTATSCLTGLQNAASESWKSSGVENKKYACPALHLHGPGWWSSWRVAWRWLIDSVSLKRER